MTQLQAGENLGPYQIITQVGKGGMAAVYKAFHPATNRHVAVKVLPENLAESPEFINRFRQEAQTIANLQHPHILPVFDYGEGNGRMYMVMRFLETGTLQERMEARPLTLAEIDKLFSQLLEALEYAHSNNVIHRDIKPSNALVDSQDNLFLTDFGIAKILEKHTKFTQTGAMVGTPDYMSPEQAQGQTPERRSDIYSLGIILYQMITGRVPFEAETPLAVILKHLHEPLPPPSTLRPGLPLAIEAVILKALAKRPEERFATCAEFLRAWKDAFKAAESGVNLFSAPGTVGPGGAAGTTTARPTGTVSPPAYTAPPSSTGTWDTLIIVSILGVIAVVVCLVVAAGLGGLTLLTSQLFQGAVGETPLGPTARAQVTELVIVPGTLASPTPSVTPAGISLTPTHLPVPSATNVSNNDFESESPQIMVDAQGTAHVVWGDATARKEGDVLYSHSTADGWTDPEQLSGGRSSLVGSSLHWLTRPDGTQCVLWYILDWQMRCLQGGEWTATETFDFEASWADSPAFAFRPDGTVAVAWSEFSAVYFDGQLISSDRFIAHDLRMALDAEGNPMVVWSEQVGSDFVLQSRHSPDGGVTWGEIEPVSDEDTDTGLSSPLGLAADLQGRFHVAWTNNSSLLYRQWTPDAGWSSTETLRGGRPLIDLTITTDAEGFAHIVGSGMAGSLRGIIYFQQTGAGWQPARPIAIDPAGASVSSRNGQIVVGGDGVVHFVWQSADQFPDVFYARLP